jgi:hypothetical protein
VKKQQFEETALIKPADKFWPIERYTATFGSPDAPRNRALKHRKCKMSGYIGVLVPGDNGEGPWDVVTKSGERVKKEDELDVGSDGGDSEEVQNAFMGQRRQMRKQLAEAAAGAMNEVLLKAAMTEEEKLKEQGSKRKKTKKGKKAAPNKIKANTGFFNFDVQSDDSNDDCINDDPKAKAKRTLPTSAKALASDGSPAKGASSGSAGAADAGKGRGAGAPQKDVLAVTDSLWQDFATAGQDSMFFCRVPSIVRRSQDEGRSNPKDAQHCPGKISTVRQPPCARPTQCGGPGTQCLSHCRLLGGN